MSQSGSGDTGTGSIEVSVPTDLTVTTEGDSDAHRRNINVTRHTKESEKGQLQKTIEKLKLELQEKDALIGFCKSQYTSQLGQKDLEMGVKLSEKQVNINRLEAELSSTNDELKLLKERAAKELAHLLQKCLDFQQNQARLMVKHDEIKSSMKNLSLSESEFERLKNIPQDQLTLQQFASIRVYEMVMPLQVKVKELESIKSALQSTISAYEQELEMKRRENSKLVQVSNDLKEKLADISLQCEQLRTELKADDFRVYNFDRIKKERDKYEGERDLLDKQISELEFSSSVLKSEKKALEEKVLELKSKLRDQEQALVKYKNEYVDARSQLEKDKEYSQKTSSRLKMEQERSDTIHEKFLKAKMEILSLTDSLQDAQNELKNLQDMYSRSARAEKESTNKMNELQKRYSELTAEIECLQSQYIKEKDSLRLEIGQLKASYFALSKAHNTVVENSSTLAKEKQASETIIQENRLALEEKQGQLKHENLILKNELEKYKALENDYLSTLKVFAAVSAEGGKEEESQRDFPISSIVRGKLSEETILLTRRILHLERQNVEACSTIQRFTSTLDQMRSSLASYKVALSMADRPTSQLLQKIRSQEEQIIMLEETVKACNDSKELVMKDLEALKKDLAEGCKVIEQSRIAQEEIVLMKREISSLQDLLQQITQSRKRKTVPKAITISKVS